ncbi:neutral/alkaline non-lysosomal ceramidase N-terminal domain-containing protein [Thermococcus gammatolerans]|nr:neutral/alkaline non-lysosomal ceramidase N-terminal domain-containing protein [Thermococcus gammatolerans]
MLVASGKVEITPEKPMPMAGYALRKGRSVGTLDPLYAKALYLEEERPAVIISLDLVRVDNELYREIARKVSEILDLPKESVLVSATHTHSGPEVSTSFWNSVGLDENEVKLVEEYRNFLVERIGALVESLQPKSGELYAGSAEVRGVSSNRVSEDGPLDRECVFLFSEREAIALNFACHPTVLPAENRKFSGDLAGAIARLFESKFRTAMFLNGAAGNVSTRFTRRAQTPDEVLRLARLFYEQVAPSFGRAHRVSGAINVEWRNLKLKLREFPPVETVEKLERDALRRWKESVNAPLPVRRMLESNYLGVKILKRRLSLLESIESIDFRIAKMSIGRDLVALFVPAELFVEYQIAVKEASTYRYTMLVGYSNGYWGYVPYGETGDSTYEMAVSLVHPDEYDRILETLVELVKK